MAAKERGGLIANYCRSQKGIDQLVIEMSLTIYAQRSARGRAEWNGGVIWMDDEATCRSGRIYVSPNCNFYKTLTYYEQWYPVGEHRIFGCRY